MHKWWPIDFRVSKLLQDSVGEFTRFYFRNKNNNPVGPEPPTDKYLSICFNDAGCEQAFLRPHPPTLTVSAVQKQSILEGPGIPEQSTLEGPGVPEQSTLEDPAVLERYIIGE